MNYMSKLPKTRHNAKHLKLCIFQTSMQTLGTRWDRSRTVDKAIAAEMIPVEVLDKSRLESSAHQTSIVTFHWLP